MAGVMTVGAQSARALFGNGAEAVFSGAITFCLLSVISAMILTGPRIYYAMARDGLFFKGLARLTPAHKTPTRAIMLQGAVSIVMVLTSAFDKLLIYIGFTLSLAAMLTVAGMMVLRATGRAGNVPYKTIGYPVTPVLFILCNLWIIVFAVGSNPTAAICRAGTLLSGLVVYACFHQRAAKARSHS